MSSFGKAFHVEKRWKLIREMGSGAYGFVMSAVLDSHPYERQYQLTRGFTVDPLPTRYRGNR